MEISEKNFFTASDGAHLYYEDRGEGLPIVMVPGFLCTSRFFEKNAEALSKEFRVVTVDPRGNGYSSKTCSGNTLKRHAMDIYELIGHLGLERVVLLGWSLAASVVVTYASEFKQAHLNGLVLMDGSLYPFSGAEWNHHRGRNFNVKNWMDTYLPLYYNPQEFYDKFIARISNRDGMSGEDRAWITEECKKTMPWSALELHYDFCQTDNVKNLGSITVPTAVFGANSAAYGLEMVQRFAAETGGYSEVHCFYESGHLMFLYEAEKFNSCLAGFVRKAEQMRTEK
ncbi:MAG: alpha/beta hydrolase [Eubacteriales bacterium]|nr:alpha/beta hydrolase [Eubacteriales bacterium]